MANTRKQALAVTTISEKTLRRAKDELGIEPRKDGKKAPKDPWLWELPPAASGHLKTSKNGSAD
jgi:signal recognition particle subunit SEC65